MSTLILMSDNRDQFGNDYNSLTAKINSIYAEKWGYDFSYRLIGECRSPKGEARHPSWCKLLATIEAIQDGIYDLIVYIDTDCIFKNQNMSIEEYLKSIKNIDNGNIRERSITFLNNRPWHSRLPCAGFYIVRTKNTEIFDDWFNSNISHYNLNHDWEQHALHHYLLPKWSNYVEIINDVMFLEKENQFLRHIGTNDRHNRLSYFKAYLAKMG